MIIRKLKDIYLPHETSESVLKVPHQKTFFSAPTTTDDGIRRDSYHKLLDNDEL